MNCFTTKGVQDHSQEKVRIFQQNFLAKTLRKNTKKVCAPPKFLKRWNLHSKELSTHQEISVNYFTLRSSRQCTKKFSKFFLKISHKINNISRSNKSSGTNRISSCSFFNGDCSCQMGESALNSCSTGIHFLRPKSANLVTFAEYLNKYFSNPKNNVVTRFYRQILRPIATLLNLSHLSPSHHQLGTHSHQSPRDGSTRFESTNWFRNNSSHTQGAGGSTGNTGSALGQNGSKTQKWSQRDSESIDRFHLRIFKILAINLVR